MNLYTLENKVAPWGDYGNILLAGMTMHEERKDGLLQLERTGPFVPPIIISGIWDLIVTDEIKNAFVLADLRGINFKPVIKKHIAFVDWMTWDLNKDEPFFYPEGGEPEGYILDNPHSEELAENMGPLWELVMEKSGTFTDRDKFVPDARELDLFMPTNRGDIMATENAKEWISQRAGHWITFKPIG